MSNRSDTRMLDITYTSADPVEAKTVADEVATVAKERVVEIMNTQEPTIVEEGNIPENPYSPSTMKNVVMAGALGVFLSAFVIVVLYLLNDTIKSGEDIEKYLGLTTLGMIPAETKTKKKMFGR